MKVFQTSSYTAPI